MENKLMFNNLPSESNKLMFNNLPSQSNKLLLGDVSVEPTLQSVVWPVTSQGDGTGRGYLRLTVPTGKSLTLTADGSVKFYTDSAGTLGESTSVVLTAGTISVYIKCVTNSGNISFSDNTALSKFGSASSPAGGTPGYSYVIDQTNTPAINISNWDFPNCTEFFTTYTGIMNGSIAINQISRSGTKIGMHAIGVVGTLSQIPTTCTIFGAGSGGTTNISGNINTLPLGIVDIGLYGANTITGDLSGLPSSIKTLTVLGSNTILGDVSGFPAGMTSINLQGSNIVSGNISGLPSTLTAIVLSGSNTVSGNISALPSTLTNIQIEGSNTLSGDLSGLTTTNLSVFVIQGDNTIIGNTSSIPLTTTYFWVTGDNSIYGTIINIPTGMTVFSVLGTNHISGDVRDFNKSTISYIDIEGLNTISGVLDASTYDYTNCYTFVFVGNNTISGDFAKVPNHPTNLIPLYLEGNNTIDTYTAGRVWPSVMGRVRFYPIGAGGLSATEMDNLLIDLSTNVGSTTGGTSMNFLGTNAVPSAVGLVAEAALESRGWTINHN